MLGEAGDPGRTRGAVAAALGIEPAAEGDRQIAQKVQRELADLRTAYSARISRPGVNAA